MHRITLILIGVMVGLFAVTSWAAYVGLGARQPEKHPISIREESARGQPLGRGHHRTRFFFIGGGLHGGK